MWVDSVIEASGLAEGGSIGWTALSEVLLPPNPPAFWTNMVDCVKATFSPSSSKVSTEQTNDF